jgi:hypothetical protein
MHICPLCNGFHTFLITCSICSQPMEDKGRIMDYYDDYSPYMEIELMKKDGFETNVQLHNCVHVFYCPYCLNEDLILVKE